MNKLTLNIEQQLNILFFFKHFSSFRTHTGNFTSCSSCIYTEQGVTLGLQLHHSSTKSIDSIDGWTLHLWVNLVIPVRDCDNVGFSKVAEIVERYLTIVDQNFRGFVVEF